MKLSPETRRALADILKNRRTLKDLTQEILASHSGVSVRSIQRAERDGSISQENLGVLASTLGTTAEELLKAADAAKDSQPG